MIKTLGIERFKSIRSLSIPCRKVNVFIGAPDTGKTNILEALEFLSCLGWGHAIGPWLRLNQNLGFDALFYRQFFDQPVMISIDDRRVTAEIKGQNRNLKIRNAPGGSEVEIGFGGVAPTWPDFRPLRFYAYITSEQWAYSTGHPEADKIVIPPHGENLIYIARHNAKVYDFLKQSIADLNWKLRFDQAQKRFVLSEVRDDDILDYNLELLSDSLRRLFFYAAILLTSEDATIVLDEPDVAAFPPYPKTLGEMIAADVSNQFFITTHNPYFLAGVVQKTLAEHLALFVCSRDSDGGTGVKLLSPSEVERVIEQGASVFFNLDRFLES